MHDQLGDESRNKNNKIKELEEIIAKLKKEIIKIENDNTNEINKIIEENKTKIENVRCN